MYTYTRTSVSPTGWPDYDDRGQQEEGTLTHTYVHMGPQPPCRLKYWAPKPHNPHSSLFSLYSFLSISFFCFDAHYSSYVRWHAYTYMCVKCIWSKQKYKGGERERDRGQMVSRKKKTISWGWRGGGENEGLKETGPFTPSPTYSQRASRLPCLSHFLHQDSSSTPRFSWRYEFQL